MLGLTKKRRQASMWESGPSGKRRARLFAVHRYRKSGPRKTAFTGLRKKTNDCRYIDDAGACTSRRRPAEEVRHPSKESGGGHGKDTERARKEHGEGTERPQKTGRGSKEGQERLKRAGWRGGEVPIEVHEHKKPAPSSGAGTLLGRSQIRASRHCQPSHARGWRTHA